LGYSKLLQEVNSNRDVSQQLEQSRASEQRLTAELQSLKQTLNAVELKKTEVERKAIHLLATEKELKVQLEQTRVAHTAKVKASFASS